MSRHSRTARPRVLVVVAALVVSMFAGMSSASAAPGNGRGPDVRPADRPAEVVPNHWNWLRGTPEQPDDGDDSNGNGGEATPLHWNWL